MRVVDKLLWSGDLDNETALKKSISKLSKAELEEVCVSEFYMLCRIKVGFMVVKKLLRKKGISLDAVDIHEYYLRNDSRRRSH